MDLLALAALAALSAPPSVPSAAPAPLQGAPQRAQRAQPAGTNEEAAEEVPPIQAVGDFYVLNFAEDQDEAINLEVFVQLCQEATGRNFTYSDETANQLSQRKVRMYGTKRIPRGDFYRFFQIMMFIHDFVCVEVGPRHLSVIVIQSLSGPGANRQNIKQRTIYVDPDDLEDYADQPAVLVTTVIHLPHTDVRQLPTTLRPLLTDQTTQNLLAVGNTNSVILTNFGSQVAALARLLYIVDAENARDDTPDPVFATIPLEHASAEELADLIDQLMSARQGGRAANRARPGGDQGVAGALRGGGDFEPEILVDARTNSLIIMALPEDMPSIKELVARLDTDILEPERNYRVYPLENVQAEEIADVLDDFLRDASRLAEGGTGGAGRPQGQGTSSSSRQNEVVVVADPNTNSLLIAASKTRYEDVLELLRQLDKRQDQVLIETALIELTGSNMIDIGFEWGLADVPQGDGEDGAFGATNFSIPKPSSTDITPGVGVTGFGSGITAGIIDFDEDTDTPFVPFLLRFVEGRDDTNVLNVPSILVHNNGSARVRTLDEQPFTQVTTPGAGGVVQENFQGYQEAGIDLTISPSISASRYLRLGIELEVSVFGQSDDASIPPPRITRELSTTVNVPDGDTMVVGGIIKDDKTFGTSRVPLLADVPLVGRLFRRDRNSSDRTTLYFFVTPYILRDKDFADLQEISYQKKLRAAEVIGYDRVKLIDEAFGTERDEIDFSSFDVPLYTSPPQGEVDSQSVGLSPLRREKLMKEAEVLGTRKLGDEASAGEPSSESGDGGENGGGRP